MKSLSLYVYDLVTMFFVLLFYILTLVYLSETVIGIHVFYGLETSFPIFIYNFVAIFLVSVFYILALMYLSEPAVSIGSCFL